MICILIFVRKIGILSVQKHYCNAAWSLPEMPGWRNVQMGFTFKSRTYLQLSTHDAPDIWGVGQKILLIMVNCWFIVSGNGQSDPSPRYNRGWWRSLGRCKTRLRPSLKSSKKWDSSMNISSDHWASVQRRWRRHQRRCACGCVAVKSIVMHGRVPSGGLHGYDFWLGADLDSCFLVHVLSEVHRILLTFTESWRNK